jgi:flagellar biogenesis protein FliO
MNTTPDFSWLFIQMLAGLILVLALAVVVFRFVLPRTRLFRGRLGGGWATVLDVARLDPHHNLYLVKIAERYMVLGSGEKGVTAVAELTAAEGERIVKGEA